VDAQVALREGNEETNNVEWDAQVALREGKRSTSASLFFFPLSS